MLDRFLISFSKWENSAIFFSFLIHLNLIILRTDSYTKYLSKKGNPAESQ